MAKRIVNTNLTVILAVVVGLMIYGIVAKAGLEPPAPPGESSMKTLDDIQPGIPIQSLSGNADSLYVIAEPGSYYLTGNISGVPGKNGIEIASDNVSIDLGGFALIGIAESMDGITSGTSHYNIAVANGSVSGWGGGGLNGANIENSQFADLRIYGNTGAGLIAGKGSMVNRCTAQANGFVGIGTNSGTVNNCTAYSNSGIGILADNGSTVVDCSTRSNGSVGIRVGTGGGTIRGCTARYNDDGGISAASGCAVSDCTAEFNDGDGFNTGEGCTVVRCTARSNKLSGIYTGDASIVNNCTASNNGNSVLYVIIYGIYAGAGSTVTGSTAFNNGNSNREHIYGIYAGLGSTVTGNTAVNNGDSARGVVEGIYVGLGSTVTGNTAVGNGVSAWFNTTVYGIHVGGGSTVTGNTARGNGDSALSDEIWGIKCNEGSAVIGNASYYNGKLADWMDQNIYGIGAGGRGIADQNTAYGHPTNMKSTGGIVYGTNHWP